MRREEMYKPTKIQASEVQEKPREIKKPFTFINLQVDTNPEDIMQSTSTYTYIQGTENDSILAPLDNVFDPSIEQVNMFGTFLEMTENPNNFEYRDFNKNLAIDLTNRALSSIMFNALGIYSNGLKKFIEQFLKKSEIDTPVIIDGNGFHDIMYRITYRDLFRFRNDSSDVSEFNPYYTNEIFEKDIKCFADDLLANALETSVLATEYFSSLFNKIISNVIAKDKVNLKAMAQYVIEADGMDFNSIDETQYIGISVGAMNQMAIEDIKKIKEIAEIHFIQAASQYNGQCFRSLEFKN